MCGLFGWQFSRDTTISNTKRAIIASVLALEMDKRGGDSFGTYADGKLARGVATAAHGIKPLRLAKHKQLLGHTRKATTGAITSANAHPFAVGSIIGAHNGIVHNHTELNSFYKRTYPVDSMHIFAHLDEDLPLGDIEAYGAITFIRQAEPEHVYLGRFHDGELAVYGVGEYPEPEAVIWASTSGALLRALSLSEVSAFRYDVKQGALYRVVDGKLYGSDEQLDFAEPTTCWDWRDGSAEGSSVTLKKSKPQSSTTAADNLCEVCADQVAGMIDEDQGVLLCLDCTADHGYYYGWGDEESLVELAHGT
jgi:hypothetical protein